MYFSPKSSSSSICLLRDWARSHLYSLPGLTIATPQINYGLFLTAFLLQILCFTKNRSNPTGTDFAAKITKLQNLGKQCERSLCLLKIEISTNSPTNLTPNKIRTPKRFQTQNSKTNAMRPELPKSEI